jgi:two-component system, chemotaxis family, chemotaxis protein CheY
MKALIVEDDFTSRKLMQKLLEPYATCNVAANGEEGIQSFQLSWQTGQPYDLICLDIMMPGLDGHAVLKEIRAIEKQRGVFGRKGVKIIMTTALDDSNNVMKSFKSQCDSYIVKPVDKQKLLKEINALGLLEDRIHQSQSKNCSL